MTRVYIAGVGMVPIGRHYGKSLLDLAAEAAFKALDEAGLEPDVVVVTNMLASRLQEQDNLGAYIASGIGLRGKPALRVEAACGSGGAGVYTAYSMVRSGLARSVLVVGVEKMTDYPTSTVTSALAQAADAEYELFYGASFTGLNALMMRYYMERHNVDRDTMSEWPVMMHENALSNPYAQIRRRITREDVARSQVVADPIRLLDSSPIGDGAAAVLLVSEEAAAELPEKPSVYIAGAGMATDTVELSNREALDRIPAARAAAEQAYRMAGVGPGDIDVAEIHDAFTINAVLLIEELGFAPYGEAARLLAEGRFHPGDRPTLNPSGGLKARGHPVGTTGVYQIAEVTMQLRGDFPGVRVDGAETGLAVNMGGDGSTLIAHVLRRV
ncbi:Acetyl-CoA acetyltransferase [Pyrodictium delaneyi]|uniref:Acetyl-CoA acetyltransferase n=1 Tax=Pyrodictium delaneyi TaxID=1273541 RepID=A0A0P0N1Y1_9CREN|nr:thiolase domain-containing protein [Pyrodictium delaneyi]ALL00290.1 Acetyl-CoA acetyltransferase [Pyrodictium delaneyi]OWJ54461.1 acetyl-CoA acetyltransferase [Pyrodictium delaneyi]